MKAGVPSDPILFWTAVAALGQVAGAMATAAAVMTTLWIVLSERRPRLRVIAGLRLMIPGDGTPATDVISVSIANIGVRRVRCVGLGWRTGRLRWGPKWLQRQQALQNADYMPGSAQLPFDLDLGEEKSLLLAVESYQTAVDAETRAAFFLRRPPWSGRPQPTRTDVIVALAAHKGVFGRVEADLAHFLAFATIPKGAARFNERVKNGDLA